MVQAVAVTANVRNYRFENVILEADTGLLFQDGHVITETSYFAPEGSVHDLETPPREIVQLDGGEDIVIGYNNAHGAYQHWLTQCLPAIDWSLRQKRTRGVRLLLPALEPWQEDFIRLLGYSGVPRLTIKPGTFDRLPHAEYSEFLNGKTSFNICVSVRDTARRILERLPPARPSEPVLFLPCSNAS